MAMDMPPQQVIEYRIDRPASASEGSLSHIASVIDRARMAAAAKKAPQLPPVARMMPAIDVKSRALTQGDREALVGGMKANNAGRMAEGVAAPNSYVGDRIRLAAMRAQALEASRMGHLRVEQAEAVRCRTIAVAMDKRAGAYIQGGERAAQVARASIPQSAVQQCRLVMAEQQRTMNNIRQLRSVSPETARETQPRKIEVSARQQQGQVRIDPQPQERKSINPQRLAQQKVSLSL